MPCLLYTSTPDEKDSYIEIPGRIEYEYAQNMLFPRMYSSAHNHVAAFVIGHIVTLDVLPGMVLLCMGTAVHTVSYTHLDVYKRQHQDC